MKHRTITSKMIHRTSCFDPDDAITMLTRMVSIIQEFKVKCVEENGKDIKMGVVLPDLNVSNADVMLRFVWERDEDA